ncbi:MAG: hypothetical protein HC814_01705 [Rhodobacteraceae bacterium]|nr:hypothetical protein [Paracoccaceae bacterium]
MKISAPLLAVLVAVTTFFPATSDAADAEPPIGLQLIAEGFSAPSVLVSIPDGSGRLLVPIRPG